MDTNNYIYEGLVYLRNNHQHDLLPCRQVLLDAARKVGIEGAPELLEDPNKGLKEVFLSFPILLQL